MIIKIILNTIFKREKSSYKKKSNFIENKMTNW